MSSESGNITKKDLLEYSEKEFRIAQVPISLVPSDLPQTTTCTSCGEEFSLNWLEKRFLQTNLSFNEITMKYLKRVGLAFYCPKCNSIYNWNIPQFDPTGTYHFYGDEAYRHPEQGTVVVYSFIGASSIQLDVLEKCLYEIKKSILPDLSPNSWILTAKAICSGEGVDRQRLFEGWTSERRIEAIQKAQEQIKKLPDTVLKVCSVGIAKRPKQMPQNTFLKFLKKESFWSQYVWILDAASELGVLPKYFIESDGKDGWGRQDFVGLKYTPLFAHISRSNIVGPPAFVKKSQNNLTQLADVVAFVTAREVMRVIQGLEPEFSTKSFGTIKWFGFDGGGNPRSQDSVGYPWEDIHDMNV